MELSSITVLGGSASTNIGLPVDSKSWPDMLREIYPSKKITHISHGGLSYVKAAKDLSEISPTDLIIVQFSISIGWPRPVIGIWNKILQRVFSERNEFWLDQPLNKYSGSLKRKVLKNFLRIMRNFWKYVLFSFGLYRSKTSIREITDQIDLVLSIASQKSKNILWIQLGPQMEKRILLERKIHERYYKATINYLSTLYTKLRFLDLKSYSKIDDFYLYDGVHLSSFGHKEVLNKVILEISKLEKAQD